MLCYRYRARRMNALQLLGCMWAYWFLIPVVIVASPVLTVWASDSVIEWLDGIERRYTAARHEFMTRLREPLDG